MNGILISIVIGIFFCLIVVFMITIFKIINTIKSKKLIPKSMSKYNYESK